jgi:hypothetical protein
MFDREIFDRLDGEVEASSVALRDHLRHVVVTWYGDNYPGPPERPFDMAWVEEHNTLRARRDKAEADLEAYLTGRAKQIVPGGEGPIPIPPGSPLSPERDA